MRLCAAIAVCHHPAAMTLRSATCLMMLMSAIGLTSCSALVDPDTRKLGSQPIACQPGHVISCPCDDGHWSSQRCNDGGSYDACACGGANSGTTSGSGNSGPGRDHGQAGSPAR
jgi:hypothetical protein